MGGDQGGVRRGANGLIASSSGTRDQEAAVAHAQRLARIVIPAGHAPTGQSVSARSMSEPIASSQPFEATRSYSVPATIFVLFGLIFGASESRFQAVETSMVRRWSTVRVRQRASRKASKWPFLLPRPCTHLARSSLNLSPGSVPNSSGTLQSWFEHRDLTSASTSMSGRASELTSASVPPDARDAVAELADPDLGSL
jgi:hypothetical protein